MKVRVKFAGDSHHKFGMTDIWLFLQDDVTVEDVLAKLERERGVKISLEDVSLTVLVNGRRIEFIGGPKAKLKDMDEIVIVPIIAGGL
ncbi:MAG: MoaD/ThiS family protein [Candidatus Bathyarchaeia archaeon]